MCPYFPCCSAGLDDENRDLRQKLSSLMQESRNKDSVNQGLTQEVSELKLKKENAALGKSSPHVFEVCKSPAVSVSLHS